VRLIQYYFIASEGRKLSSFISTVAPNAFKRTLMVLLDDIDIPDGPVGNMEVLVKWKQLLPVENS